MIHTALFPLLAEGMIWVLLVLVAQSLARRAMEKRHIVKSNETVGLYLGLIGALYGITLAFIMTGAWNNQEKAREIVDQEAQVLGSIAFFGRGLSHPDDERVVRQVERYRQKIVKDEWPKLAAGFESSQLDKESASLGLIVLRYDTHTQAGEELKHQLLTSFDQLRILQSERRLKADYRTPGALWLLIIFGAVAMLVLCFLLDIKSRKLHLLQTGMIASFLVLSVVITWDLQNPFRGFSNVDPDPFLRLSKNPFLDESAWLTLNQNLK